MGSIKDHLEEISVINDPRLWNSNLSKCRHLDITAYRRRYPVESSTWFPTPLEDGIVTKATKSCVRFIISPLYLVRALMDTEGWKALFPCIIVDAKMVPGCQLAPLEINQDTEFRSIEVIAELQSLCPLASVREIIFERSCHRLKNESWLLIDRPMLLMEIGKGSNRRKQLPYLRSCLVRPSRQNGVSTVTWIEMIQSRRDEVHQLYSQTMTGGVFGADSWLSALALGCRRQFSPYYWGGYYWGEPDPDLQQLVILANEMKGRFCSGLSCATPRATVAIDADKEVAFGMEGLYWTAAMSAMFPVPASDLFNWVVPSIDNAGQLIVQIPANGDTRNCISLHFGDNDGKRVLRETYLDSSSVSIMVTAPLDASSISNKDHAGFTSVLGLSIHSQCTSSLLTIALVQPAPPSPSDSQQNWMNEVTAKICNIFREVRLHTSV